MKIITIIGARPQFIKAAALSRLFASRPAITELLLHTGQHYDDNMSDVFFAELGIPKPAFHLGIGSGSHGLQTGRMLEQIESILLRERPRCVLVYGDTNSTLAGALAASKLHIPCLHVEAGLRSFNKNMPEEVNRVLTDHVASHLFVPTEAAVINLKREGIVDSAIHYVGDVMYDVALSFADNSFDIHSLALESKQYVLATIHRAENTDVPSRLSAIMASLNRIALETTVVLPLHPRTKAVLAKSSFTPNPRLRIIDPVGYLAMTALQKSASLIVTDSGGVQKEAFFHRVPCVTLRDETEWVELVQLGWNRLLPPTSADRVYEGLQEALHQQMPAEPARELYGGGQASARIVSIIQRDFA